LDKGKPVPDAAAAAKAAKPGSTAAQTFSKMGPPDQLVVWETDNQKFESWFYWSKNNVFHFQGGELSVRSDWNTADLKPSGGTGGRGPGASARLRRVRAGRGGAPRLGGGDPAPRRGRARSLARAFERALQGIRPGLRARLQPPLLGPGVPRRCRRGARLADRT